MGELFQGGLLLQKEVRSAYTKTIAVKWRGGLCLHSPLGTSNIDITFYASFYGSEMIPFFRTYSYCPKNATKVTVLFS